MRIRVIAPICHSLSHESMLLHYLEKARADTYISITSLEQGPESIECLYEDAVAAPHVIQRAIEAEKDGVDAVIIDCMNDPGLEACREAVSIPVIGAAQSAMLMSALLAHKFSIIGTSTRDVFPNEQLVCRYGLNHKYASTRSVDIPVLDLQHDQEQLLNALVNASKQAIQVDGAHAIIFGCTGMKGMADKLRARLSQEGISIIIIDPSMAALKWAELLVDLHLSHSRRTYPSVREKFLPEHREIPPRILDESGGLLMDRPNLHVLVPVVQGYRQADWLEEGLQAYMGFARSGTHIQMTAIDQGPASIETIYDVKMATPGILRLARKAQQEGATALIIDCMSDPGLEPAREASSIPVIGPSQTAAFVAASLGQSFSILGTRSDMTHKFVNLISEYGLGSKLASVRATGLSVQEVESDTEGTRRALIREAVAAVNQDDAHVLIPGCTGMIGISGFLQEALSKQQINVPVLEPPALAVKMAEILCDLGLSQSKVTYPDPPKKKLVGYPELEIH